MSSAETELVCAYSCIVFTVLYAFHFERQLKDQALSWVGHIASGDHSLAGCILIKEMLDRPSLEDSHPSCADGLLPVVYASS